MEQLRNEFLATVVSKGGTGIKEFMYEYLFNKSLVLTEDLISSKETTSSNQLRVLQEQLKNAESECLRYKTELNQEKDSFFRRI